MRQEIFYVNPEGCSLHSVANRHRAVPKEQSLTFLFVNGVIIFGRTIMLAKVAAKCWDVRQTRIALCLLIITDRFSTGANAIASARPSVRLSVRLFPL